MGRVEFQSKCRIGCEIVALTNWDNSEACISSTSGLGSWFRVFWSGSSALSWFGWFTLDGLVLRRVVINSWLGGFEFWGC